VATNYPEEGRSGDPKKHQNLWDTAKAMIRGKFIATSAFIKKIETS
jgi:hypothetical protein